MRILSAGVGVLLFLMVYRALVNNEFIIYSDQLDRLDYRLVLSGEGKKTENTGATFRRVCLPAEEWQRRYRMAIEGSGNEQLCRIFPDSGIHIAFTENGVLSFPEHLRVGQPVELSFRFSLLKNEEPEGEPFYLPGNPKPVVAESNQTDNRKPVASERNKSRSITIFGDGFEIDPKGTVHFELEMNRDIEFTWAVTPLSAGQQILTVDASTAFVTRSEKSSWNPKTLNEGAIALPITVYTQSNLSWSLITASAVIAIVFGVVLMVPLMLLALQKYRVFNRWGGMKRIVVTVSRSRLLRWLMSERRFLWVGLITLSIAFGLFLLSDQSPYYSKGAGIGFYCEEIHVKEGRVYIGKYLLEGIDGESATHLWRGYIKDRKYVYFIDIEKRRGHRYCSGIKELRGLQVLDVVTNPASFELLENPTSYYSYARDDKNLYALDRGNTLHILDGFDPSFEPVLGPENTPTNYHKDKFKRLYFYTNIVEGADFDTFSVISRQVAIDKNSIYVRGRKIADKNGEVEILSRNAGSRVIAKDDAKNEN